MRVVVLGAGKIACGYLAPLFVAAGHEVTLACRAAETATRIGAAGGWQVVVTGGHTAPQQVRGVAAVVSGSPAFVEAVASADLVCTAVGVGNVAALVAPLAEGLAARGGRPVDVWLVENDDCAPVLRDGLAALAVSAGLTLPPVGLAGAVAGVAVGRGGWRDGHEPVFVGDAVRRLAVDGRALLTGLPALPGVEVTDEYRARLHEKLYVFNAGHAIVAYLGWLRGHDTVAAAVADPTVRPLAAGCLLESRRAVLAAYPALAGGRDIDDAADVHRPVAEAMARYADAELADPIIRVARDPLRKLAPGDRLLGPVRLIRRCGRVVPAHFALGIAAALLYGRGRPDTEVADDQARRLRGMLSTAGVVAVLAQVCGLAPDDPIGAAVAERYRGFVFTDQGVVFPPVHTAGTRLALPPDPRPAVPAAAGLPAPSY